MASPPPSPSLSQPAVVLPDLLANATLLHYFQKFLEREYSEENLLFYLEVERLKTLSDPEELRAKALEIYQVFVDPSRATHLVNLTEHVVALIQQRLGLISSRNHSPLSSRGHSRAQSTDENPAAAIAGSSLTSLSAPSLPSAAAVASAAAAGSSLLSMRRPRQQREQLLSQPPRRSSDSSLVPGAVGEHLERLRVFVTEEEGEEDEEDEEDATNFDKDEVQFLEKPPRVPGIEIRVSKPARKAQEKRRGGEDDEGEEEEEEEEGEDALSQEEHERRLRQIGARGARRSNGGLSVVTERRRSYLLELPGSIEETTFKGVYVEAQLEVQTLIERDTLPRFLKKASFSGNLQKPRASKTPAVMDEALFATIGQLGRVKSEKYGSVELVGVLKRRAGFMSTWRPFKYAKKGAALLEYRLQADIKKENPLRCIRLKNAIVYGTDVGGKDFTFCILTLDDSRTYFLQAISEEEKQEWLKCLESTTSELSKAKAPPSSVSAPSLNLGSPSFETMFPPPSESHPASPFFTAPSSPVTPGEPGPTTTTAVPGELAILQVFDKITEAMLIFNAEQQVIAANPAACVLLGDCKPEELISLGMDAIFAGTPKILGSVKESLKVKVNKFGASKGTTAPVSISLGHLQNGCLVIRMSETVAKFSFQRFALDRRMSLF